MIAIKYFNAISKVLWLRSKIMDMIWKFYRVSHQQSLLAYGCSLGSLISEQKKGLKQPDRLCVNYFEM